MHLNGCVVHHLNFRVNEQQRSCLGFALRKFVNVKTVASLSHEAVLVFTGAVCSTGCM